MDDSYLAMAREAASLCSSIQVQLAKLAAIEAAGATEVEFVAGTSGMEPLPAVPGTSVAATITPARRSRATKTSTPVRPNSDEADGNYEDFRTVMDDNAATLDGSNVELMLEKSVKPSTREKYSPLWDKWVAFSSSTGYPRCHRR
jgi:hypothetical protein